LVSHIPIFDILRKHAVWGVCLDVDPLDAPFFEEVVDVSAAEGRAEGAVDRVDGDAQGPGFDAVDIEVVLRGIREPVEADLGEALILSGETEETVCRIG
jgi:hypothetical protein